MTPGVVVAKHGSERTILTARGPIRFKTSLLDFFLYGGRWEDFIRRGGRLGWLLAFAGGQHMTRKQIKCSHDLISWEEEQRLPTKLHAPVPARILLCVECGLGIAFKL
jgi:hypothetical protein